MSSLDSPIFYLSVMKRGQAMQKFQPLAEYLEQWAGGDAGRLAVAEILRAVAGASGEIAALIESGPLAGALGAEQSSNADGDVQKELDLRADDLLLAALSKSPVAAIVSEEQVEAVETGNGTDFAIAIDPLDGSSNIDTNSSIGTIFSIVEVPPANRENPGDAFLGQVIHQVAAGYIIYGPQTALVMTVGSGTQIFTLDRRSGDFLLTGADVRIPEMTSEFAINMSNYDHWSEPVRWYIDDCIKGERGPRGRDFNMRWVASLVAECHRILSRGGIFLYPADMREGYGRGRLRLLYEALPIAWLIEEAGGLASTGAGPISECRAGDIHQRVPFIFGSLGEVRQIERYKSETHPPGERSPLFGYRGLFRA
jgi:fructose-1,6-bisphosphatase I